MEYTVEDRTGLQEYVTHEPIDGKGAVTPDSHGVYPVNPMGFPVMDTCGGDAECLSKGNPEFPQGRNFGVSWKYLVPEGIDPPAVDSNIATLSGLGIVVPVTLLSYVPDTGDYEVTVPGNIVSLLDPSDPHTFGFENAGVERYEITNLVGGSFQPSDAVYDGKNTVVTFAGSGVTVRGSIGEGRISLAVDMSDGDYVLLTGQENKSENGLYMVREDTWPRIAPVTGYDGSEQIGAYCECPEDGPECDNYDGAKNPYCSPASIDNSPTCGHYRHGYSDREVADGVMARCAQVIEAARHPMAIAGDLTGAGRLAKWFVECGKVNLGGSTDNGRQVVVDGFGLGGEYSGDCTYGNACRHSAKETKSDGTATERPWLTFSIGARRPEAGETEDTLPRDWPFTSASDYATDSNDNNITLLKPVARMTDDSEVGGLETDLYETCRTCDGTGEHGGETCPACGGTGTKVVGHRVANRIHVCLNNDFKPDSQDNTVFKKTYVHLPTPIDTPDGDEFEVTVSMPTVNTDGAFEGMDPVDAQRAYYAFISQPRVVVMGGYWKFSTVSLSWKLAPGADPKTSGFTIPSDTGVVARDGTLVTEGTKVRFTLDGGNNCPRYSDMTGILTTNTAGTVAIGSLAGYPYGTRLRDRSFRICGLAYLDPVATEQDDLNNYCDISMGLHSRNSVTLGDDTGTGDSTELNYKNKFIAPVDDGTVRSGRDYVAEGDGRQVLAAVYPTTTNTFQWSMVGRHKMRHLDVLMTDEWDLGEDSVSSLVWKSNREILERTDTVSFFGTGVGDYSFTSDTMPLRYAVTHVGNGKSLIGSQLRVTIPTDGYFPVPAQPVRQARKAARMLAGDFMKLRMYHGDTPTLSGSSYVRHSSEVIDTPIDDGNFQAWWTGSSSSLPSADVRANDMASAAWLIKARHLPEYISMSGLDEYSPANSLVGIDPFVDSGTGDRYSTNPYGNTEYGSTSATRIAPCTVSPEGGMGTYGFRSIITAMIESDADAVLNEMYNDALRVTELQRVTTGAVFDPTDPYGHLVSGNSYEKWMDIFSATSNVFSIDTIPSPVAQDVTGFDGLTVSQLPMISGEPFAMYRMLNGDTVGLGDTVTDNLPFYDGDYPVSEGLTGILRDMVAPYGSRMPLRWWDSNRIGLPRASDVDTSGNIVYLSRLKWAEDECGDGLSPEVRSSKVDDEFISRSSSVGPLDPNWNRVTMSESGTVYVHDNWSASPMKVDRQWYNRPPFTTSDTRFMGPSGYIRVFMRFKFSAQAGRWYTVDYIQAPMSYLTPLYGAAALDETIDGKKVWVDSRIDSCSGWQDTLMHPYYKYPPMDIHTGVVPLLVEGNASGREDEENGKDTSSSTVHMPRLERPFMSVAGGGLGLSAPVDVNGNRPSDSDVGTMTHANFWSVREHLRPAVSAMDGADIPGAGYDGDTAVMDRKGGVMGDPVLWGQYSFPRKGEVEYIIPEAMQGDECPDYVLSGSDNDIITISDNTYIEVR